MPGLPPSAEESAAYLGDRHWRFKLRIPPPAALNSPANSCRGLGLAQRAALPAASPTLHLTLRAAEGCVSKGASARDVGGSEPSSTGAPEVPSCFETALRASSARGLRGEVPHPP
jgi:hypothetical protein